MKIKAVTNFAGIVTMHRGEVKDVKDEIATDLVKCGYVEAVKDAKASPPPAQNDDGKANSEDDGKANSEDDGKANTNDGSSTEPPAAPKAGKSGKSNK